MNEVEQHLSTALTNILATICRNEDKIRVHPKHDQTGILLTVLVAKEDMGIVIGRAGQTISALRSIFRSAGAKHGVMVSVFVSEPTSSIREMYPNTAKSVDQMTDDIHISYSDE